MPPDPGADIDICRQGTDTSRIRQTARTRIDCRRSERALDSPIAVGEHASHHGPIAARDNPGIGRCIAPVPGPRFQLLHSGLGCAPGCLPSEFDEDAVARQCQLEQASLGIESSVHG